MTVVLEEGRSYRYILYGGIANAGVYSLNQPDFRVLDAIALAGGAAGVFCDDAFCLRLARHPCSPLEQELRGYFQQRLACCCQMLASAGTRQK